MSNLSTSPRVYEPVIGLEVHVQIKTNSKLFCACETDFGAAPNSHVCPVCTGQPGVLPVLNKRAVEGIVKVGLALGCQINRNSYFARKQYFYPDLPKAYQISQSDQPVCGEGGVTIHTNGNPKLIRIQRIHLEEDAGKLLHSVGSMELPYSLVDLNRSSIPLMEIVSHPDIGSADEAYDYLSALKATIQYVGVSDCDMEKGSLRCDANVSVRLKGESKLGKRVEIKNMNSFRAVKDAIIYEMGRQIQLIEAGGAVVQETRLWNESKAATFSMRSKEEAHDYRYFPEPDLLPVQLSAEWIESMRQALPELPEARKARLVSEWGLSEYDANVLVGEQALVNFFETGLQSLPKESLPASAKLLVNWITTELLGRLNQEKKTIQESPLSARSLAELVELIQAGTLSGKMGKEVFGEAYSTGDSPKSIVAKKGLSQVSDEGELLKFINEVIQENPKVVADVIAGKDRAIGSLVGALMKKTKGRANPQLANDLIKKQLAGRPSST
ncbi:MAG: Aspartyl/glutamyl-tRNA(Asn/Gln) amidotransferase subunit B [Elusimicrobia bacterium]|nr:Aspartyl/glutamyl-tRNA(Asn/Gln) amidotransferase subunit B [Elusimicrobiota bacterium]